MHRAKLPLTERDVDVFADTGVLYVEHFYEHAEVVGVQRDIYELIGLLIGSRGLSIEREPFSAEEFDSGLDALRRDHRTLLGDLYDATKKLPSYIAVASSSRHKAAAEVLLRSDFVGMANRGFGIRMDHPDEDKYLTQLHQDYPSQLCSPAGVVFWSPLRRVSEAMGPVAIYEASHRLGILPIDLVGSGSYGLQIHDPSQATSLPLIRPEVDVTDAVLMSFLTVHESSPNRSTKTRWAMISRYFDFREPIGRARVWKGGLQEGGLFADAHPELCHVEADGS